MKSVNLVQFAIVLKDHDLVYTNRISVSYYVYRSQKVARLSLHLFDAWVALAAFKQAIPERSVSHNYFSATKPEETNGEN
jgi:uncharacterized membrane protein